MKTDEEVLKECVKIAVGNGWDIIKESYTDVSEFEFVGLEDKCLEYNPEEFGDDTIFIYFRVLHDDEEDSCASDFETDLTNLLFSHSFCRKLFGEQKAITEEQYNKLDDLTAAIFSKGEGYENMECRWQHHIQKLALSTDRISYLRKWLNNSSKA
jgi:hypothetical protein